MTMTQLAMIKLAKLKFTKSFFITNRTLSID
jgi:hypothetical protein